MHQNIHTRFTEHLLKSLIIGNQYTRESLVPILQVLDMNALRKGVVGKTGEDFLMIFVTENKSSDSTQYKDHLFEDTLFWEGENKHGHDRIISSEEREIFLMYRQKHHSPFTYMGRLALSRFFPMTEEPSKFVFRLIDSESVLPNNSQYEIPHPISTTRENLIAQRVGQDIYRKKALEVWGEQCAVTGVDEKKLLIASHIKPWREASNEERLDGHNSLILTPTYDRLFDSGLISFNANSGKIILSSKIRPIIWEKLGVDDEKHLRFVPLKTDEYLQYHRNYIFNFNEAENFQNSLVV